MKTRIAIITPNFLNPDDPDILNIGGVETWIGEFVRLLVDIDYLPVVYQISRRNFAVDYHGIEIIGLGEMNRHTMTRLSHKDIDKRNINWIVYASSFVGERYFRPGQVFIQHGIHWDYTTPYANFYQRLKWEAIRRRLSRHDLKMSRRSRLTIAVDSNFLNYARVMLRKHFDPNKVNYIPNFAQPQNKSLWQGKWDHPDQINIIFARRFEMRRGVAIFVSAIEQLLENSRNIRVLFAGWGSASKSLEMKFKDNPRITIKAIPHEKMSSVLNHTHIAVIPSTYSEGTSLSCLEAMASGCAVVATNVGGLCNIVLPDFNGMLIRPTKKDIVLALSKLTHYPAFAEKLAKSGYETLCQSFSLTIWRHRVKKALMEAGVSD